MASAPSCVFACGCPMASVAPMRSAKSVQMRFMTCPPRVIRSEETHLNDCTKVSAHPNVSTDTIVQSPRRMFLRKLSTMKAIGWLPPAVLIAASVLALYGAAQSQPAIKRTDLQRHDLSVPGREVIQVLVEF